MGSECARTQLATVYAIPSVGLISPLDDEGESYARQVDRLGGVYRYAHADPHPAPASSSHLDGGRSAGRQWMRRLCLVYGSVGWKVSISNAHARRPLATKSYASIAYARLQVSEQVAVCRPRVGVHAIAWVRVIPSGSMTR